jgi:DNA-binding transcriptional regulator LsrR (DeoR family)
MRAVVGELPAMDLPQHRVVGLVGSIARDGRANPFEVVMRLADRIGAECYPLPAPGIVESVAERNLWQAQRGYRRLAELASRAQLTYLGIGHLGRNAPLLEDGFITDAERQNLLEWGAVGEMLGWPFDRYGQLLDAPLTERVTSLRLPQPPERLTILIGTGPAKVEAIVAALQGRCVNGIVTDEATVRAVLEATSGGSQKALDSETEAV